MHKPLLIALLAGTLLGCGPDSESPELRPQAPSETFDAPAGKPVVYQVFTRLYGNTNTTNKPWGTIEENGVGKFADFNDRALASIKALGTTHIWYTGVPHHAVIRDYSEIGIADDDPDVVKGRAGSPYAVKDYYSVNPDLATDPARRLEEFEALIARTNAHGMQVLIDIVPNHVARGYASITKPPGVEDFGAADDTTVEYRRDNNFYYVPGQQFAVPDSPDGYAPLGGDPHPLADRHFAESPAKWTGNGARAAKPDFNDWFETVKINFGVRPDGSTDFERLPAAAADWSIAEHAEFWDAKDVPDSWKKFLQIALYWTDKGVDGFRYDMAEMVPVEFWSYMNSGIKTKNPDAFLLAEVYNPALYRDYLFLGRMDYLYDKVGFYDALKPVMQGRAKAADIVAAHAEVLDIEQHMLHFLENHDEQRIASPDFAGDAMRGKPGMVVSALISRSPTMLYFAQDLGEPGEGVAGFGDPTRTTIFDYWGVPSHQRFMNEGAFDGGRSTADEKHLRDFYVRLMSLSATSPAMLGNYAELHSHNLQYSENYGDALLAFARWQNEERVIVVSNFAERAAFTLKIPTSLINEWQLSDGRYALEEQLYGAADSHLIVEQNEGRIEVSLDALESAVFKLGAQNIVRIPAMESQFDLLPRNVDVWLPRNYHDDDEPYAVLYMHDGQNLFNADMSFQGVEWGVDEAVQSLIDSGAVRKTIVVGVWNSETRWRDYIPTTGYAGLGQDAAASITDQLGGPARSTDYLRFLVEELKPVIDSSFRTRTDRDNTFLAGSSMGGLISMEGMIRHTAVFSAAACLSTHWPAIFPDQMSADRERIVAALAQAFPSPAQSRWYFDHGTTELDEHYAVHQQRIDSMLSELGFRQDDNWVTRVFEGTGHHEKYWQQRIDVPLQFLLAGT